MIEGWEKRINLVQRPPAHSPFPVLLGCPEGGLNWQELPVANSAQLSAAQCQNENRKGGVDFQLSYWKWQKDRAKITKVKGFQYGCLALNKPSYFITGTISPLPHTDAKSERNQNARIYGHLKCYLHPDFDLD